MYQNKLFVGISVAVILIIVIVGLYYFYAKSQEPFSSNNLENGENSGKEAKLMFFYANWCPHCKEAKPEWKKVTEYYSTHSINGYKLKCIEYDCTEPSAEIDSVMDKYSVDSYPTVILEANGSTHSLTVKPTLQSIQNFVDEKLNM